MKLKNIVTLFLFSLLITVSQCVEYYVEAPGGTPCPRNDSCYDLSHVISHSDRFLTSNTVLTFLEGTHILELDEPIVVSGVSNLTLQGLGEMEDGFHWTVRQSNVFITCEGSKSGIFITDFFNITISKLTIIECGVQIKGDLLEYVESNYSVERYNWEYAVGNVSSHSLLLLNGSNVIINELSIQNGTGYGLTSVNVYDISMNMSYFSRNNIKCLIHPTTEECRGGNVRIVYLASTQCPHEVAHTSVVSITNSSFSFSVSSSIDISVGRGGGLALIPAHYNCSQYEFQLKNIQAYSNKGSLAGNIAFCCLPVSLTITNLNSTYDSQLAFYEKSAGLYIVVIDELPNGMFSKLSIDNSRFMNGFVFFSGGGLTLITYTAKAWQNITIASCTFSHNDDMGIWIENQDYISNNALIINMIDINVFYNDKLAAPEGSLVGAIVLINTECHVSDLHVINNLCTGMTLYNTFIHFSGYNLFQNNSFSNGGGMALFGISRLILYPTTNISFIDNHADQYGGAIYVPIVININFVLYNNPCFFQVRNPSISTPPNITIYSMNNTAGITGTFLSGGQLEQCFFLFKSSYYCEDNYSYCGLRALEYLLHPKPNPYNHYFLSSVPIALILCKNGTRLINITSTTLNAIPGKALNISLTTVGEYFGISPANISVSVYGDCKFNSYFNYCSCSDDLLYQFTRETEKQCTDMTFVFNDNPNVTKYHLVFNTPAQRKRLAPLQLFVDFEPCPGGFEMYNQICDCNEYIRNAGATCDINTTSITTDGNIWIGYDNSSNCTLVSDHHCPYDYCVDTKVNFSIDTTDLQCNYHRSGILCGECAEGYSLLLGSNKCGICPNDNYLSLLLVFGVAGVALVVLLIGLNLTVSVGTINGLIFYANIVKVYEGNFFPHGPIPLLSQFISWINLDVGIETCFYEGMTPYAKVWLQFVFPIYIWLIIILIIIVSHYSIRMSRLVGSNAVPVLATLFLLSYVKIIRINIVALRFFSLENCGQMEFVWAVNGNLKYIHSKHSWLFATSLVFVFVYAIPYTLLVMMMPLMELKSHKCGSCWLKFFKPFSDAYGGPFKDRFRFWTGLFIFTRLLLTLLTTFADRDQKFSIVVYFTLLLLSLTGCLGGPYKKRFLNILEIWFLANILLFVFLARDYKDKLILIILSPSLVFVTFVGIILFHIISRVKKWCFMRKKKTSYQEIVVVEKKTHVSVSVVRTLEDTNRFRESLFEDDPEIPLQESSH